MAYSTEVSHTQSGGSNRDFTVTFPFLETTDLRVQLGGVTKALDTDYTIVQSGANTVVNFNTAPTDGSVIRIFRDTDIDAITSTFAAGSAIRSGDLNNNNKQLLYAAQEFGTLKEDNSVAFSLGDKGDIQVNSSSDWVIQNNTIEQANMADNSIGNNELIDGSITGGKLASLAISTAQLAATAVTTAKIANDAITSDKITDGSIITALIANDAVEPNKVNQTTAAGWGFTPAGTVIWYAGSTAPTGYLKANGDSIPNGSGTVQGVTTDFAGLYAVVGANVPDLRGEFIRALDDGRGVDDSRGIRTAQTDVIESHTHVATTGTDGAHTHTFTTDNDGAHTHTMSYGFDAEHGGPSSQIKEQGQTDNPQTHTTSSTSHQHSGTTNTTNSTHTHNIAVQNNANGGTETRPRNVALLACIKY